jgi:predicted transcriptional regulator YheO
MLDLRKETWIGSWRITNKENPIRRGPPITKERRSIQYLLSLFPVANCVADFMGPNVEAVLHRLSDLEHSIVKIRNGHVTGRKVGDSMTDFSLHMITEANKGIDVLGNYNAPQGGRPTPEM